MKVARINGGWPARDRFDDAARKARDRGIEVPLIDVIDRFLKASSSLRCDGGGCCVGG
jgi:hypothetical protein